MKPKPFNFKEFDIYHHNSSMKVGTDAVLLGSWVAGSSGLGLDIGTGCGIIALMLAQRFENLYVKGIDIHEGSVKEAQFNFAQSPWGDRLQAENVSLQYIAQQRVEFDLIVSNPPFFVNSTQAPEINRNNARHTGNLNYKDLVHLSSALLKDSGSLALILPSDQEKSFVQMARERKLYLWRKTSFRPKRTKKIERTLLQFSKSPTTKVLDELVQYTSEGDWTPEYKELTWDFYLKLI